MSDFGEALAGGSRFVRWTLSPFVVLFAVLTPVLISEWTPIRTAIVVGMELMCFCLLAAFWLPPRIGHWAFRGLAGLVFLAYAGYLIDEFFFTTTPLSVSGSRGQASPRNALLGFLIIGLPCLWYSLFGRFALRAREPGPEVSESDAEQEDEGD
jgi:hypothetical protein